MRKHNKKRCLFIIAIFTVCVIGISGLLGIVGVVGASANMKFAQENAKVETRQLQLEKDQLGYWTFTKAEETNFKILQLTDIHIGSGFMSIRKDNKALVAIKKLVQHTKPDLIVITGDMVYPVPIVSGSANNLRATKLLATFMNCFEIPWTVTYGNHDDEAYSLYKRADISQVYESMNNCIFQRGPEDITGMSNYFINIKNSDGKLNTTLAMFDSNSVAPGLNILAFDKIHDNQVTWYENEINRISDFYNTEGTAQSLAFFHVPLNEFIDAWELYKEGSDEVIYHYGKAGEKGEKILAPSVRGNLFEKMVELGSTKGVFVGHDHLNDFSVSYEGIRLTFSKSIAYLAILPIANSTWQRGGTVIEIDERGEFHVDSIAVVDIQ